MTGAMAAMLLLSLVHLGFTSALTLKASQLESQLLSLLSSPTINVQLLRDTVAGLEVERGILRPTQSPEIDGVWRLLYTGNEVVQNASPIQRTVTSLNQVKIFQVVHLVDRRDSFLRDSTGNYLPDVSNVVCFGNFRLRVTALGSTVCLPIRYASLQSVVRYSFGKTTPRRWQNPRTQYFWSIKLNASSGRERAH